MSAGLKEAPLTTDKEVVAELAVDAARRGKTSSAPPAFQFVMMVLKHIPGPIFRQAAHLTGDARTLSAGIRWTSLSKTTGVHSTPKGQQWRT